MKTLVFQFENPSDKDKSVKEAVRLFGRAGAQVVTSEVDKATSKRSGVAFRNFNLTFADGQTVVLAIKSTGDVFEVRVNGKVTPMRHQDDHKLAIEEIAAKMDAGRAAFQKALAKIKTPLPPGIKVSRANVVTTLTERRDALKTEVEGKRQQLADLTEAAA
jgi:Defence against restriction A N-terminal